MVVSEAHGLPVAFLLSPHSTHESQLALPTLAQVRIPSPGRGRPKKHIKELAMDTAFDSQEMLCLLSSADPTRVERHLLRQHTVDDPQDLSHTRHHSSFFVLSTYHQALKENLDDGVEADCRKARHVQQSP